MIIQIFIFVYGLIICHFLTVDFILYQNKSSDFGLLENNWLRRQCPILNVVKSSKTVSEEEKCVLWNQPKLELKEKCCNLKKNIEYITQISERHAAQRNASLCSGVGSDVDQPTNPYFVNNSTKTNDLSCSVYSFLQLPFLLAFALDWAGKIVSIKETRFSCEIAGDPNSSIYHNPGCTFVRQDQVDNGHIQTDSSPSSIPLLNTNNSSEHLAANHVQEISSLDTQLSRLETSVSLGEPNHGPPSSLSTAINSTVRGASNIPQQAGSLLLGHPCYPIYITLQKRYESFNKWPIPHIQSPRDLAVAGFFYAGYDDCVRCYHCGLGLKSWKLGDDVYTEHEKLRPSCEFLQSQRYISSTGPARDVRPRTSSRQNEAPHASGRVPPSVRQQIGARASSILQVDSVLTDQSTPDGATGSRNVPDLECDGLRPVVNVVQTEEADSGTNATARAVDKNTTKSLLKKENKYLHQLLTCKVCEQAPIKDLFLPCGDLYACTDCAQRLTHCPLCKKRIMGTVTVYFS
ncbi:baculoviral IAP repeat-containing protein 2-like isoform X1 [Biomphalaria pfeifferi]|uniref:Baculoviral IAP repeat-containing protein 2-like isoform X1 n=1 Tax=Biomphalaria pfeifferi TaxID=112525 RepID=A0AAD8C2M5_BIOPF|nr:baculoviral IAP repeat-containing protein 2-like isoform X1 [Biomphalaria pfeifferi]